MTSVPANGRKERSQGAWQGPTAPAAPTCKGEGPKRSWAWPKTLSPTPSPNDASHHWLTSAWRRGHPSMQLRHWLATARRRGNISANSFSSSSRCWVGGATEKDSGRAQVSLRPIACRARAPPLPSSPSHRSPIGSAQAPPTARSQRSSSRSSKARLNASRGAFISGGGGRGVREVLIN